MRNRVTCNLCLFREGLGLERNFSTSTVVSGFYNISSTGQAMTYSGASYDNTLVSRASVMFILSEESRKNFL